jgi:hypothetical protein
VRDFTAASAVAPSVTEPRVEVRVVKTPWPVARAYHRITTIVW